MLRTNSNIKLDSYDLAPLEPLGVEYYGRLLFQINSKRGWGDSNLQ
jgi:hypothetical protein